MRRLHPYEAFEDRGFREDVAREVEKVKGLVGRELERLFGEGRRRGQEQTERESGGSGHAADADAAVEEEDETTTTSGGDHSEHLKATRDWTAGLLSGVHAVPSMNHLHVHVLSPDHRSECVRHRKHYNSFSTPFLVPVSAFPLAVDDPRRHPGREGYLERDLVCWRCGQGFGRGFKALKEHLEGEFERWKNGDGEAE